MRECSEEDDLKENLVLLNDNSILPFTALNNGNASRPEVSDDLPYLQTMRCTCKKSLRRIDKLDQYKLPSSGDLFTQSCERGENGIYRRFVFIFNAFSKLEQSKRIRTKLNLFFFFVKKVLIHPTISLTSIICKFFLSIIVDKIVDYL